MTDDELARAYAAARRRRAERPVGDRPSPEELAALATGSVRGAEREALLERALASGAVDELTMLRTVVAAANGSATDEQEETRARTNAGMPGFARRWWPAAAAAALVVTIGVPTLRTLRSGGSLALARDGDVSAPTYRAGESTGPRLVSPEPLSTPSTRDRFVWTAVPGATAYLLELVDGSGHAVTRVRSTDTMAFLPDSLRASHVAVVEGWWVIATSAGGVQTRSPLRLFRDRSAR